MTWIIQFPLRRIVLYTSACQSACWPSFSASFVYRPPLSTSARSQSETHGREKTRRVNKHALKQARCLPQALRRLWLAEDLPSTSSTRIHIKVLTVSFPTQIMLMNGGQVQPQACSIAFSMWGFNINTLSEPIHATVIQIRTHWSPQYPRCLIFYKLNPNSLKATCIHQNLAPKSPILGLPCVLQHFSIQ